MIFSRALPAFLSLGLSAVWAQIPQSANFVKGGIDDAQIMMQAYLKPLEKGMAQMGALQSPWFGASRDSAWHWGGALGFGFAWVPQSERSVDVNTLGLQTFEAANPTQSRAQTVAGNASTILLQTKSLIPFPLSGLDHPMLTLASPQGAYLFAIPLSTLSGFVERQGNQFSFSLLPPIGVAELYLWGMGIGAQHSLQSSVGIPSAWGIQANLRSSYFQNHVNYALHIIPDDPGMTYSLTGRTYHDQALAMTQHSIPLDLQILKSWQAFTWGFALGYQWLYSRTILEGYFPVYAADPTGTVQIVVTDLHNPLQYSQNFSSAYAEILANYRSAHWFISTSYRQSASSTFQFSTGFLL